MAKHVITPAWQTSRGPIVQAHGCAEGVPVAGAKVFGETRQNLWVNPTVTIGGVTATETDDGALTLSGTASSFVSIGAETFALKPSTAYTISVDKVPGTESTATLNIREKRADGSYIDPQHNASTGGTTFTTSVDMASCECKLVVISDTAVSGTYRVMLNEGGEPQPWCPPGLSSVSELGLVSAGKNLLKINSDLQTKTMNGVTFTPNEDGTVTVNGTATDTSDYYLLGTAWTNRADNYLPGQEMVFSSNARAKLYGFDSSGSTCFYAILNGGNQIISAEQIIKAEKIVCYLSYASGQGETNKKVYAQLELGSTATAYEPPGVATPIDLSGHQLRSLPDGTRDVLTVDGSGAVSVEQAVGCLSATASTQWMQQAPTLYWAALGQRGVASTHNVASDLLPSGEGANPWEAEVGVALGSDGSAVYARVPSAVETTEQMRDFAAGHCFTYPLATPQTAPLDPITPPTIPAADATLWAASDVPCDIEATTWTASGAEQGRQQAAMVKVAQQVRQQAETVAALTTQALEA